MPLDRKTIAARIKALLAKTSEKGCTEAEAASAAAKARELLDRYQIDLGAIGIEEEGTTQREAAYGAATLGVHIRRELGWTIGKFCDCKAWSTDHYKQFTFFGLQSDVDFAEWLSDSLSAFVDAQLALYHLEHMFDLETILTKSAQLDFLSGIILRIKERLNEQIAARKPQAAATGRELMVLKNQIVTREFAKLGLTFRKANTIGQSSGAHYHAGRSAGDKASFGRPVGGAKPLMIRGR